jgi:hypothetical protein
MAGRPLAAPVVVRKGSRAPRSSRRAPIRAWSSPTTTNSTLETLTGYLPQTSAADSRHEHAQLLGSGVSSIGADQRARRHLEQRVRSRKPFLMSPTVSALSPIASSVQGSAARVKCPPEARPPEPLRPAAAAVPPRPVAPAVGRGW